MAAEAEAGAVTGGHLCILQGQQVGVMAGGADNGGECDKGILF